MAVDLVALAVGGCAAAVIAWMSRGWFFYADDWNFILYRRSGGLSTFFAPYIGHLFAGVLVIYRLLFATVGLHHSGVYDGVEIALHVLCCGVLYTYARRRGVHPVVALFGVTVLLFLGSAWQDLFWLASCGFIIPLIAFMVILMIWDSNVRGANLITAVVITAALLIHSTAVALAVGLGVASMGTGRSIKRLAAIAVPLCGWGAWFVFVRPHLLPAASLRRIPGANPRGAIGPISVHVDLAQLPGWLIRGAGGALGSLAGKATWQPGVLFLGVVALVCFALAIDRRRLGWRFAGIAVALLCFLISTWLSRSTTNSPDQIRYLYPMALLVLMLLAECLRGQSFKKPALAVMAVVVALCVWSNIDTMRTGVNHTLRGFADEKAKLAELESCRGRVPPSFRPEKAFPHGLKGGQSPIAIVRAGPYWAATQALGDPVSPAPAATDPMCPA